MTFIVTTAHKYQISWAVAILATVGLAVYATIYSLTHGIHEVFPFLYFLPIIIFVYQYPSRGVLFSLGLSTVFLSLVYYYGHFNTNLIAVSTAWFVIFVTIGVVTSSFAEGLRAEERRYRGIFENSQAGIFTFDIRSRDIREINGKFARMLNYEREDLLNQNLSRILFDADGKDAFIKTVTQTSQTGDLELFFHTRDNIVRQFLISASLSPDGLAICSAIDITDRKIAEQVVSKARDELEQRVKERTEELMLANEILKSEIQERKRFEAAIQLANRKLNTLSSITRHDILNQITAIVMYLSLAEETVTDPGVIGQLHKIEQITDLIQKQIRFTRDYQNIGENALVQVPQAVRPPGRPRVVGHHDDGLAQLAAQPPHEHQHVLGRDAVEVACGLVGHEQGRVRDQGARNGHPLLLAAGELPRGVVHAVLEADQPQHGPHVLPALPAGEIGQHERQLDVLEGRQHRDEVVELENEADVGGAPGGELGFGKRADVGPPDGNRAGVRAV